MSAKCVRERIINDTTSRTAADVMTANPGKFASVGEVPVHLYKCAKDLLFPSGVPGGDAFPDFVIAKYGEAKTMADAGIELAFISQEADISPLSEGKREDTTGAEYYLLRVMCRLRDADAVTNPDVTEQLDLRIRYLIDSVIRGEAGLSTIIPSAGVDNTVDKTQGVACYWLKYLDSPNTSEYLSLYCLQFTRVFGK